MRHFFFAFRTLDSVWTVGKMGYRVRSRRLMEFLEAEEKWGGSYLALFLGESRLQYAAGGLILKHMVLERSVQLLTEGTLSSRHCFCYPTGTRVGILTNSNFGLSNTQVSPVDVHHNPRKGCK